MFFLGIKTSPCNSLLIPTKFNFSTLYHLVNKILRLVVIFFLYVHYSRIYAKYRLLATFQFVLVNGKRPLTIYGPNGKNVPGDIAASVRRFFER